MKMFTCTATVSQLTNIETDEEYEIVSDAFDELLDEQEFNEIMGDFDDEEQR